MLQCFLVNYHHLPSQIIVTEQFQKQFCESVTNMLLYTPHSLVYVSPQIINYTEVEAFIIMKAVHCSMEVTYGVTCPLICYNNKQVLVRANRYLSLSIYTNVK